MYSENELYHHGVKGMKWGVRRKNYYGQGKSTFKASNGLTVGAPKNAGVAAFRKVQGTKAGSATLNGMSKMNTAIYGRGKNKSTWKMVEEHVRKENQAVREANQAHKTAKSERKNAINSKAKELNKNASMKEKLVYNNATRKLAAKYIVDNNMTVAEATEKAHGKAWRNTQIFMGVYGATLVASYAIEKKKGRI